MQHYYAASTNGFYLDEPAPATMPADAVPIAPEVYAAMFEGQANGQMITPGEAGQPCLVAYPEPGPPPEAQRVTARQARLALLAAGELDAVTEALDALPEADRAAARIEWEFATTVERSSPLVQMLAQTLDLDLDELFAVAATL